MKRFVLIGLLLLTPAACDDELDFESFCDDLFERCADDPDYALRPQECRDDARTLERAAMEAECDSLFDLYVGCVESTACDWNHECTTARHLLDECIDGPF